MLVRKIAVGQYLFDAMNKDSGRIHLYERFFYAAFVAAVAFDDSGLVGNAFQAWYMQRNVTRGSGESTVIVVAAVPLTGFIALVACCLSFSASYSSSPFRVPSTLSHTNFFNCPLKIFSLNYTIFSDIACLVLSECFGVITSFYQSLQAMSFYFSILRNLLYLILNNFTLV